jgi:phosphatidyl-myo-inositol dimannoside synthase
VTYILLCLPIVVQTVWNLVSPAYNALTSFQTMVAFGVVSNSRKTVALVTSGLGSAYGGIGVVARSIRYAVEPYCKVVVWQHPPFWPRSLRIAKIAAHVLLGSQHPPDVVIYDHVHLAVLHAMVPKFRNVPYAVFIHGVEVWQTLGGRRREALLGASVIVANSATTVAATRRANPWLPEVHVAWLGIPGVSRQVDPGKLPPHALIVGRMSSPERYKGHDAVMDAWPLIRSAMPQAQLTIIGTGSDEPRLRRRVEQEHLTGIRFLGRVSDEERDRAYCSSRLLFYPSEQEGFGLAGIEAASFGVPFMGLVGTVTAELFPDGNGVVLAKDLTPHSIAEAAIPVLTDSRLASTLGNAARKRVHSTFLEEHFAARFRHAVGKLLHMGLPEEDRAAAPYEESNDEFCGVKEMTR